MSVHSDACGLPAKNRVHPFDAKETGGGTHSHRANSWRLAKTTYILLAKDGPSKGWVCHAGSSVWRPTCAGGAFNTTPDGLAALRMGQ